MYRMCKDGSPDNSNFNPKYGCMIAETYGRMLVSGSLIQEVVYREAFLEYFDNIIEDIVHKIYQ